MHLCLLQKVILILDDAHDLLSDGVVLLLHVHLVLRANLHVAHGLISGQEVVHGLLCVSRLSAIGRVRIELSLLVEPR